MAPLMTGDTVTHYRVGDKLGEGGSALVYRAVDLALGREVVIKFFARDGAGAVVQFQHEARTISCLNHPNICTIYDIGEHEGRPFLVMEMLDGQVLSHAIGGRPMTIGRVIDLGAQIAEALDAAHAERIIHRDVKPANIFVTRSGRIKLLDFGVAVMRPPRMDPATARTLSSTGGTIPYMSPEQARVEDLDHRSDLFSLGTVLYEMAAGRRPFVGATPAEVLSAIIGQLPVSARSLNPAVPLELERIISKALEKNPALRYQTASDLRADLQRLRRDLDLPSSSHGQLGGHTAAPRSIYSSSRLRMATAVGALVAGAIGWLTVGARLRSDSSSAERLLQSARGADIPLTSDIQPAKRPVEPVHRGAPSARGSEPRAARGDAPSARPGAAPPRAPAQPTADVQASPDIDRFLIAQQQIDLKLYDNAIDNLQKVAQDYHRPQAIDALFLIASIHDTRGDTANAMSTYIEIANRFPDDPRAAEALGRLAQSMLKSKRPNKEKDARRTFTDLVRKYPDSSWAPRALLMRGDIEARQGQYQRDDVVGGSMPTAAVTYREITERYASTNEATVALNKLAHMYADAKRFEIAAATFEDLAARDAAGRYDAWFAAGELFEKRLKDNTRARAAYSRVSPSSPHYAEAQKRISR